MMQTTKLKILQLVCETLGFPYSLAIQQSFRQQLLINANSVATNTEETQNQPPSSPVNNDVFVKVVLELEHCSNTEISWQVKNEEHFSKIFLVGIFGRDYTGKSSILNWLLGLEHVSQSAPLSILSSSFTLPCERFSLPSGCMELPAHTNTILDDVFESVCDLLVEVVHGCSPPTNTSRARVIIHNFSHTTTLSKLMVETKETLPQETGYFPHTFRGCGNRVHVAIGNLASEELMSYHEEVRTSIRQFFITVQSQWNNYDFLGKLRQHPARLDVKASSKSIQCKLQQNYHIPTICDATITSTDLLIVIGYFGVNFDHGAVNVRLIRKDLVISGQFEASKNPFESRSDMFRVEMEDLLYTTENTVTYWSKTIAIPYEVIEEFRLSTDFSSRISLKTVSGLLQISIKLP